MSERAARDGRSTRWDPHRRARRAMIIKAAIAAIEEHGPDALTAQIAELAGVPRTHVYRHFDGKLALDLAVSRQLAAELGRSLRAGLETQGSPRQIIRAAIGEHLGWIEAHPNLYRFLAQHAYAVSATGSPAVDDAKAIFATELTALIARYLVLFGVEADAGERIFVGVVGMVDATAAWWLERHDVSRAELTDDLTETVWLVIARAARRIGLEIDPDVALPTLPVLAAIAR